MFFNGFRFNTNDSETPASATHEIFDNDSTKKECNQSVADVTDGEKPTECDSNVVIEYESSNVIILL